MGVIGCPYIGQSDSPYAAATCLVAYCIHAVKLVLLLSFVWLTACKDKSVSCDV
jgi:hypothetical protein